MGIEGLAPSSDGAVRSNDRTNPHAIKASKSFSRLFWRVGIEGLEPSCHKGHAPQTCVYTNSTISPKTKLERKRNKSRNPKPKTSDDTYHKIPGYSDTRGDSSVFSFTPSSAPAFLILAVTFGERLFATTSLSFRLNTLADL